MENTVTNVEKEEVQMPSQVTVELECQVPSCNFDGHGNKFKTPPLPPHEALQLLKIHRAIDHGMGGAEVASDHDVQVDAVPETVCKPVLLRRCSVGQFKSSQVDKDSEVEMEATPETDCRPVLPRGSSVEEFKSFNMAWALYAEKYRSQYLDQHPWEVDELRLNYLLNYELLSSIPPLMEGTIYRARDYLVDTVPTADLLLEIKKIVVEEAVKSAQQAVVPSIAKVTGMGWRQT